MQRKALRSSRCLWDTSAKVSSRQVQREWGMEEKSKLELLRLPAKDDCWKWGCWWHRSSQDGQDCRRVGEKAELRTDGWSQSCAPGEVTNRKILHELSSTAKTQTDEKQKNEQLLWRRSRESFPEPMAQLWFFFFLDSSDKQSNVIITLLVLGSDVIAKDSLHQAFFFLMK